jgi:predicted MFS family arabinose efflux permease
MLIASRFIMGMGLPYAVSGASQLIAELSYPRERAIVIGLFNESWYAGQYHHLPR